MNNISILDCTLRDGGRIIDCAFPDKDILDITSRLADANIDIIEVGFLRDAKNVEYKGNSTFFTDVKQIRPFVVNRKANVMYVAFVDYGMFDFETLDAYDGTSIDGIRVGFTKKNYRENKENIIECLNLVKERGYKLFVQGVNSLGYTDKELLEVVELVNEIHPYGFGIVDTYGAMYADDVRRIYRLVDNNLLEDISIDFHSHNNFQLSFALAQEVIGLSKGTRRIVIDATLNGMGKCAGNLNTELIVDYMVRKLRQNYNLDIILDIIDEYMYSIKEKETWGYSIPSVMAGIYKSHPNNVIYLTEKYRLATKDIKYIISMMEPDARQRYDYDYIHSLYNAYNHTKVDDQDTLKKIYSILEGRNILLLLPGSSIVMHKEAIKEYIKENNAFVISVNFVSDLQNVNDRMVFFGSERRYKKVSDLKKEKNVVVVSNIREYANTDMVVNYESLIERANEDYDNTMIMLLNLLYRMNLTKFAIAGFDGYSSNDNNYFDDEIFEGKRFKSKYESINLNVRTMLKEYIKRLNRKTDISFITPSIYSDIFEE